MDIKEYQPLQRLERYEQITGSHPKAVAKALGTLEVA